MILSPDSPGAGGRAGANGHAASALDQPIAVTFFKNYAAAEADTEHYTMRTQAERIRAITKARKQDLPWLKLASCRS
jgi:hypothetical protein